MNAKALIKYYDYKNKLQREFFTPKNIIRFIDAEKIEIDDLRKVVDDFNLIISKNNTKGD